MFPEIRCYVCNFSEMYNTDKLPEVAGVKDKHSVSLLPILDALHWVLRIIELRCVSYNLKESRQTQLERYK